MRVKQLADLVGTTVRTVRHYHHIGLLPVPQDHGGVRDYDVSHLARLARIRWLRQAGVPLDTIKTALTGPDTDAGTDIGPDTDAGPEPHIGPDTDIGPEPHIGQGARASVEADLAATIDAMDAELARLAVQRDRLAGLLATVRQRGELSPLPPHVAAFYAALADRAGDERARRLIREERELAELAWLRGDLPAEAELLFRGLDEAGLIRSTDSFRELADRLDDATPAQLQAHADAAVQRITSRLEPAALTALADGLTPAAVERLAALAFASASTERSRDFGRAATRAWKRALDAARTPEESA